MGVETELQQVGGFTVNLTTTLAVSVSPNYSTGDVMGTKTELANAGRLHRLVTARGIIQSVVIADHAEQKANIDIIFFNAQPVNGTYTDNAALALHDDDSDMVIGVAQVATWIDGGSGADIGWASNLGFAFDLGSANASIWMLAVARGAHNLGATDDIRVKIGLMVD